MKIGDKLQLLRGLKGLTQQEFASLLNMERRSYVNLENNLTKVDITRMSQIAKIYGIELEELLSFDEKSVFDKCFNKNVEHFFSVEKINSETSYEEKDFFIKQIQFLVESISEERKVFLEAIVNLTNVINSKNQ